MTIRKVAATGVFTLITGLGAMSSALASDWGAWNSLNGALKSVENWEYSNGGPTFDSQRQKHAIQDAMDRALQDNSSSNYWGSDSSSLWNN